MDLPESLQQLIEAMGARVMAVVAEDPACRALAQQIQQEGWEVGLFVEATIALTRREDAEGPDLPPLERTDGAAPWSQEDREFLKTFRIRLD